MTRYGLWFCGTETELPDWLRDGNGRIRDCASWDEAVCLRNLLYSGKEEIEVKELTDGTQEGHARTTDR